MDQKHICIARDSLWCVTGFQPTRTILYHTALYQCIRGATFELDGGSSDTAR
jgi:hypothetical protein